MVFFSEGLMRDIFGKKIGANSLCWCGSGIKYKNCHRDRSNQAPYNVFDAKLETSRVQEKLAYCSCGFDANNCSSKIVKSHSLSRGATLKNIAELSHVYCVDLDGAATNKDVLNVDGAVFKNISINRASTTRSFCEYHDNFLFRQLDDLEFRDPSKFAWQLFYRTICFERYLKDFATRALNVAGNLDKGAPPELQHTIQSNIQKERFFHTLGMDDLDRTKSRLEKIYADGSFDKIGHLILRISANLPIAASGVLQPDLTPDGQFLQHVNFIPRIGNAFIVRQLHSICIAILPGASETFLCMTFLKEHELSKRFVDVYLDVANDKINSFIGLAILLMENIFFRPSFIESLDEKEKRVILQLRHAGLGEPYLPEEMKTALNMRLLAQSISLEILSKN